MKLIKNILFLIVGLLVIFIAYFALFPKKIEFLSPFINTGLGFFKTEQKNKEVIGFLPYWMVAKKVSVDPANLTQLVYFGLSVDTDGSLKKYDEDGYITSEYSHLKSEYVSSLLKQCQKHNTKFLLTVSNFKKEEIEEIVNSRQATYTLLAEMQELLDTYPLQGFNLDFEYFSAEDDPLFKQAFNQFVNTLVTGLKAKDKDLIISFDIYPNAVIKNRPYDVKTVAGLVDEIIIMGYDFHQAGSDNAGPVSPLKGNGSGKSLTEAFKAIYPQVEAKKIVLGVPFYGYEWQTKTDEYKSFTVNTGVMASYQRVKDLIADQKLAKQWDEDTQTPFLVYTDQGRIKQIYFEDERSLGLKMDLVNQLDIKGIAIWALGYEGDYQDLWQVIKDKNS